MSNDKLHEAAGSIGDEIHAIDVRIEGLTERRLHLTRALDALRLLGIDTEEASSPPAPADPVERKRTRASSATKRIAKKAPAKKKAAASKPELDEKAAAALARVTPIRAAAPSKSKRDDAEVARVANAARERGEPMMNAVAEYFDISKGAASQAILKARRSGHRIDPGDPGAGGRTRVANAANAPANRGPSSAPFTREPITKTKVDHQRIRDEQAGPPLGKVKGLTGDTRRAGNGSTPPPAPAAPVWTPERAREHLEAAKS